MKRDAIQTVMQADALLDTGDLDGAATWRKIIKATGVTLATEEALVVEYGYCS